MSVSLFLDDSQKERLKDLESSVKASIGFDEKRGDTFSSMVTAFASVKRDEKGVPVPAAAPVEPSGPNRMMEMLIQRGIEIAAAVAFLFLLFKTLKGASKAAAETAAKTQEANLDERAIQMLAKSEIEELVKTDPALVSSILSRWATEEEPVGAGR
jgi:flagellar biosynthesis/type III secretory pathway M-ring protein FliF/YscJ